MTVPGSDESWLAFLADSSVQDAEDEPCFLITMSLSSHGEEFDQLEERSE